MNIFNEKFIDKDDSLYLYEASNSTYILRDLIYPKVEKVLSTNEGRNKFTRLVETFINKNSNKLTTVGPVYLIPFTHNDADQYFDLFGMDRKNVTKDIKNLLKSIDSSSNWLLIANNPIYVLLYYVIRYYTINKDAKMLNTTLAITSLTYYPSVFSNYFKFQPNQGVMQYTIDNLSQRFTIKKTNHVFGMLTASIQSSWQFLESSIIDGSDAECIRFIRRIRNDQNSLIKKIATNYYENHKKGLTVTTSVDSYDDSVVVDNENDSNKVETLVNRIVLQMLVNGIDLKICDFAANASNVSKIELRNYLLKISTEKNSNAMKSFIESILFIYLYDEKHSFEEINSKQFISYALALFKKTNSKNDNIINIKKTLDTWGEDSGIYSKFSRLATRVDYTKGIFLYFTLCIQKYN